MNRLKFMNQAVDEAVHLQAHTESGAQIVTEELYCNWVHLTYNWGFPPEIEQEDWQSFQQAAEVYHRAGSPVFAYIQTSNCVYTGSFRGKNWYVKDTRGRMVHYYTGRYMTCFQNVEWRKYLEEMIAGAIERGADGIFFDNLWYGEQPLSLFGAWLGGAGCYCPGCRSLYKADTGRDMPRTIDPGDEESHGYVQWRSRQLSRTLTGLAAYARSLKPDVVISANDYDPVPRPSYMVFGIDLRSLSQVQDVMMIENFSLPRWDDQPQPRLANNALTVRMVRPMLREGIHLSLLSYDVGIGFDGVYPQRRYLQGIAEAAATGCSMTIKGTEYFDRTKHTLLLEDPYSAQRTVIGAMNRWLEAHTEMFDRPAINLAPVGLMMPGDTLWQKWHSLAPLVFAAAQTLTRAGIPWRSVYAPEEARGVKVLLRFVPDADGQRWPKGIKLVEVHQLPGWEAAPPSLPARSRLVNQVVSGAAHGLLNLYFESRLARRVMDQFGMARLVTQTPYFLLPDESAQKILITALPDSIHPKVLADEPVLIEIRRDEEFTQVHLLNYASHIQAVQVVFDRPVSGQVVSPHAILDGMPVSGQTIHLNLDIYAIIQIENFSDPKRNF